jgi:hypothetical protein
MPAMRYCAHVVPTSIDKINTKTKKNMGQIYIDQVSRSELHKKKEALLSADDISIAPTLVADREQYHFRKCFSGGEE